MLFYYKYMKPLNQGRLILTLSDVGNRIRRGIFESDTARYFRSMEIILFI